MEYLFAVYSVFSFSHSKLDILLQTQCLSLNFDAKIYISAVRSQYRIERMALEVYHVTKKKKKRTKNPYCFNKLEVKVWLQGEVGGHIFYQF